MTKDEHHHSSGKMNFKQMISLNKKKFNKWLSSANQQEMSWILVEIASHGKEDKLRVEMNRLWCTFHKESSLDDKG